MAPILGYWDIRGRAQPIRLLLAHTGTEFHEKLYASGPPPEFDDSQWTNEKFTLGLDFPNLPYFIDGDVKLTQSNAIIRYIARKTGLKGKSLAEKARIDLVEQQLVDFLNGFVELVYNPDYEKLKADYLTALPDKLKSLSAFLGKNPWFAGQNLTYVDFLIYEFLYQHSVFAPGSLDAFPNLKELVARVEALPNVAAYLKSDKYIAWPFNGDMAEYGSRLQPAP